MKNKQKGFASLFAILIFIVIAGGGFYVYREYRDTQKNIESMQNTEVDTLENTNTSTSSVLSTTTTKIEKVATASVKSVTKVFKGWNYNYSFSYPENWIFQHDNDTGDDFYCVNVTIERGPCISIVQGEYTDYSPSISKNPESKQITIGINKFTTSSRTVGNITSAFYQTPIGKVLGKDSYIMVYVMQPNKFNKTDIDLVLSTLKPGSVTGSATDIPIDVKVKQEEQAAKFISYIRQSSEIFYNKNEASYMGLCDIKNYKNIKEVTEILKVVQDKIGSASTFCNTTSDKYVLYMKLSSGLYACADNTGFYQNNLAVKPKSTSCK